MLVFEVIPHNVGWGVRIVCSEDSCELFLELLLSQLYLVLWFDELLGATPVSITVVIVIAVTETILILYRDVGTNNYCVVISGNGHQS